MNSQQFHCQQHVHVLLNKCNFTYVRLRFGTFWLVRLLMHRATASCASSSSAVSYRLMGCSPELVVCLGTSPRICQVLP